MEIIAREMINEISSRYIEGKCKVGCHACCFIGRKWLQQLRRYVLRSMVYFIFMKRLLSGTLQYFYDT